MEETISVRSLFENPHKNGVGKNHRFQKYFVDGVK